ncbi:MAG TPA: EAL domain-containing protein [Deltaproteobacteria bacterium]|nr:EAL domain-containing protein [Deltaproteobacteria bacterium]
MEKKPEKFFLGRQPILNRHQEIVGYELLFRSAEANYAVIEDYNQAIASVITHVLSTFGVEEVLGGKLGFINVQASMLLSELLELLPRQQTVLELLEFIDLDEQVIERCMELKELGFQLALDDHEFSEEHQNIYEVIDIVKIDILQTGMEDLPRVVAGLRGSKVKILAEKVETFEQFETCMRLGFDLFQGYFFQRPTVLNKKRMDVSGMAMLKLLKQLLAGASVNELEQTFKENPTLSYSLLRLVNSVAMALRQKIMNLRHAIVMLGTENLRRWTQLSLFISSDARGANNPLLEMAAVRGRMMEILVQQKGYSDDYAEAAFMTGILSQLDVLFEISMSEIISSLNLSEDVSSALLEREGRLGQLLALVERVEATDFVAITPLLQTCRVSMDQLLEAQLESFRWRESVIGH